MISKPNIFGAIRSLEKKKPNLYWLFVFPVSGGICVSGGACLIAILSKKFDPKYASLDVVQFTIHGTTTWLTIIYIFSLYIIIGNYFEKKKQANKNKSSHSKKTNKTKWSDNEFPIIAGQSDGVSVSITPFPYKQKGNKKKYTYPDFGSDFHNDLFEVQLPDWDILKETFEKSSTVSANVQLPKYAKAIKVDISCSEEYRNSKFYKEEPFYSCLADAIIDAMEKNNIKS